MVFIKKREKGHVTFVISFKPHPHWYLIHHFLPGCKIMHTPAVSTKDTHKQFLNVLTFCLFSRNDNSNINAFVFRLQLDRQNAV